MSVFARRELSCQELIELLTDYLEGALTERRRRAVAAHLDHCGNCHAYLEQMRTTIALTGRLREDDVEPAAMDELLDLFRNWER